MTASGLTPGEIASAPTIDLGGRTFHIPRLALAQNRVVIGNLQTIMPMLGRMQAVASTMKADKEAGGDVDISAMLNFPMDEATLDVLATVVYAAITRGAETLSRPEFDNLPIGVDELLMAIPTVIAQSFAFTRKKREGTPAAPAGEARTASTGTPLPSGSAEPLDGHGTTSNAA